MIISYYNCGYTIFGYTNWPFTILFTLVIHAELKLQLLSFLIESN